MPMNKIENQKYLQNLTTNQTQINRQGRYFYIFVTLDIFDGLLSFATFYWFDTQPHSTATTARAAAPQWGSRGRCRDGACGSALSIYRKKESDGRRPWKPIHSFCPKRFKLTGNHKNEDHNELQRISLRRKAYVKIVFGFLFWKMLILRHLKP